MDLDLGKLRRTYRDLLLDGIAPFWLRHGIDREYGGVLSCMDEDGNVLSGDKYIWSQTRSVWTFSALFNRVERRPEFLEAAANSVRFLLDHGRDAQGRWVYHTDRQGAVIEGPVSIYSDMFAVYGFSEYYRAARDPAVLDAALSTYHQILERIRQPGFHETAPYALPPGRKAHGIPMILTEVTNELLQTTGDTELERVLDASIEEILGRFLDPRRGLVLEFRDHEYRELPPPEGTAVVPGHAIESMWFILHVARRREDRDLVRRAAGAIRRHLEAGWDPVHGGLFLGIDANGGEPFVRHAETKPWWPHTESLYALLLAHQLTGEKWCLEWYQRVHQWSFAHYPIPGLGEWRQLLTRQGLPTSEVIALPVKDPFHLPRAAILIVQLLEKV